MAPGCDTLGPKMCQDWAKREPMERAWLQDATHWAPRWGQEGANGASMAPGCDTLGPKMCQKGANGASMAPRCDTLGPKMCQDGAKTEQTRSRRVCMIVAEGVGRAQPWSQMHGNTVVSRCDTLGPQMGQDVAKTEQHCCRGSPGGSSGRGDFLDVHRS